jgi:HTH-type transcriptional regulator / antitoxin HigA
MQNLDVTKTEAAWSSLAAKIYVPHSEEEYQQLVALLDSLIDEVGEDESHPLASLMEVVGVLIEKYEDEHVSELPLELSEGRSPSNADDLRELRQGHMDDAVPLAEIEKRYILSVLQQFGGNHVRAAAALGIDRSKLYRRLRQYGIEAEKFLREEEQDSLAS